MSKTVQQLLTEIQTMVMEDASFSYGLWSTAEVVGYINAAVDQLFLMAQVKKQASDITPVTNGRVYNDPSGSMQIDRISFNNIPLYRSNLHQMDLANRGWRTQIGTPRVYHQDHLPNKQFEFDKAVSAALVSGGALINVISTVRPVQVSTGGDLLPVPDYAVYIVKFGVLQRMFQKEGEAQDMARAKYCEDRFVFGCSLLAKWMGIETNNPLPQAVPIG